MAVQTLTVNGQPVSRILVAGVALTSTGPTAFVTAYTQAGALDTTFGSGGSFLTAGTSNGFNPVFSSLVLEADGSIVVGGKQTYDAADGTYYHYHLEMLVGHLTADGTADTSFGPDGTGFTLVQDSLDSHVLGLAIDPIDGGILACGISNTSKTSAQAAVVRFTAP